MREILFRGKRLGNGDWVEGYLIHDEYCNTFIPYIGYLMGDDTDVAEVDLATVGQFTGLYDKNGKKIFEGDICRVCLDPEICTAYIEYDERTASFNLRYNEGQCNTFLDMQLAKNRVGDRVWVEVIGNIHDNPELLEVDE